jgi:hypothetical protein
VQTRAESDISFVDDDDMTVKPLWMDCRAAVFNELRFGLWWLRWTVKSTTFITTVRPIVCAGCEPRRFQDTSTGKQRWATEVIPQRTEREQRLFTGWQAQGRSWGYNNLLASVFVIEKLTTPSSCL